MGNCLGNGIKVADEPTKPPKVNAKAKGLISEMYSERLEIHDPISATYTWEIQGWSKMKDTSVCIISKWFSVGDYKWYLVIYPQGNGNSANKNVSVYVKGDKTRLPSDKEVYLTYTCTIRDQIQGKHKSSADNHVWLSSSKWASRQLSDLVSLKEINDSSRGFQVNDTCVIEAQVTFMGYRLGHKTVEPEKGT